MRLKFSPPPRNTYSNKQVTGVAWTAGSGDLYTVSDDKQLLRWKSDNEAPAKVEVLDVFVTAMQLRPSAVGSVGSSQEITLTVGCSDGSFRFLNKLGKSERTVAEAHLGAVCSLRWNYESSTLATAGEDGFVKLWSPTGNMRTKLVQADRAVYAVCWAPDNQSVLYCSGQFLNIKSLRGATKPIKWKGHEGTVLTLDWNPVNNLIVTGGEDCKFKVWDSLGHPLFSSKAWDFTITSVRWCPSGEYFAVGSFNTMALCDKTGWAHSRSRTVSGSVMSIDWTPDGTNLAGAGANGAVVFGQVVDRESSWRNFEAKLDEKNHIQIVDASKEGVGGEELDFPQRVIEFAIGFDHVVAATPKSCYIYSLGQLSTPHIMDVKGTVSLLLLSQKYFVLVDNVSGIQVFSYEARQLSNPRVQALNPVFLKTGNITVSSDCVAIIDRGNPSQVLVIDPLSGKQLSEPIRHEQEITEIALNQTGNPQERKLLFIDRNRDLYITQIAKGGPFKLATTVDCAGWNDSTDVLAAVSDAKLLVWYYPATVWVDKDLITASRSSSDASSFGKACQFVGFSDSRVTIRRADGALQTAAVSPYPTFLQKYAQAGQWARATRLCRAVKEEMLWAVLAVMAIEAGQLDTAEVALAAINEVDKLQYMQHIKTIPSVEGRNAELCLYKRRPDDAEQILVQGKLIWRAIKLNIALFRWDRALDLAVKNKSHIDTVLLYRGRYLAALKRTENDPNYTAYAQQIQVDEKAVMAKEQQELDKERERGSPYSSKVPDVTAPISGTSGGMRSDERKE